MQKNLKTYSQTETMAVTYKIQSGVLLINSKSLLAFLVLLLITAGCQPEEPITTQRIPKDQSGLEALRQPSNLTLVAASQGTAPTTSADEPTASTEKLTDRMVVGMYTTDDATWFFKINGSIEAVKGTEAQWKPMLESIEFVDGKPQWELPEGWSESGPRPMRFATLKMGDAEPPLEMAISQLGPNQDVLLNVNRWRGQMGLAAIKEADLEKDTSKLKTNAKSALLFDVVGKSSGGMGAPFAGGGRPPFAGGGLGAGQPPFAGGADEKPMAEKESNAAKSDFRFEIPDDWKPGKTSGMVPVRLKKLEGEQTAEITIVGMPASANEWEPNAQRWAGQVGMELSEEALVLNTSEIEVDGAKGKLIRLVPAKSDEATESSDEGDDAEANSSDSSEVSDKATLAAMIKRDETAWFVKLTGDAQLVADSGEVFEKFLKSLKFPK